MKSYEILYGITNMNICPGFFVRKSLRVLVAGTVGGGGIRTVLKVVTIQGSITAPPSAVLKAKPPERLLPSRLWALLLFLQATFGPTRKSTVFWDKKNTKIRFPCSISRADARCNLVHLQCKGALN